MVRVRKRMEKKARSTNSAVRGVNHFGKRENRTRIPYIRENPVEIIRRRENDTVQRCVTEKEEEKIDLDQYVGEYQKVKGHHIHAKKAFEGLDQYKSDMALAIGRQYMQAKGINHCKMTGTQKRLFQDLSRRVRDEGAQNTLDEHDMIAEKTLIEGGAQSQDAKDLTQRSRKDLEVKGVEAPIRIPWG